MQSSSLAARGKVALGHSNSTSTGDIKMKSASFRLKMAAITLTALTAMPCLAIAAISSSVNVTPPPTKLTAEEWRSLSLSGSRILKHTDQALTALADKNNEGALTNIGQGLKLVEIINSVLPASKVTTNIKNGTLEYKDADDVKPGFVPIYREYDSIDVLSPVTELKQFNAGTRQPGTVPDVAYAALDCTSVKLDIRLAKRDLESAEELVKKDDVKAATAALRGILTTGVILSSVPRTSRWYGRWTTCASPTRSSWRIIPTRPNSHLQARPTH